MKRVGLALLMALALAACGAPGEEVTSGNMVNVNYVHDVEHGVGCWVFGGDGSSGKAISCIPDQDYVR